MSNLSRLIEKFVADMENEVRAQVAAEVRGAVESVLGAGRRSGAGSRRAVAGTKGGKRTPAEIEQAAEKLLGFITKNPGQRAEQIGAAVGGETGDLGTPMKRLLREKKIKAKGKARGTTYTAV